MDTNNAYRVLGLAPGASEDEVKAAYRALAQQYAPEMCIRDRKETVQALGDIIRWFKNAGYRFDTVDHMPKSA